MELAVELDPRFLRQVILVEVGPAGQRRIAGATAAVGGAGLAGDVATRYAERAGFPRVAPGSIDPRGEVEDALGRAVVSDEAATAVLAGSRVALRAILAAAKGEG